jgi:hypothetical protein
VLRLHRTLEREFRSKGKVLIEAVLHDALILTRIGKWFINALPKTVL